MKLLHFESYPTWGHLDYIYQKETPTNGIQRVALKRILSQVIAGELTSHQQRLIKMHFYENKTCSEIADILGVNKSTVSRGISGALVTLRRCMGYCYEVLQIVPIDFEEVNE